MENEDKNDEDDDKGDDPKPGESSTSAPTAKVAYGFLCLAFALTYFGDRLALYDIASTESSSSSSFPPGDSDISPVKLLRARDAVARTGDGGVVGSGGGGKGASVEERKASSMKEVAEQSKRNADANLAMASTQNKRLALEADTIIGENAKELVTILAQEIESIQNFLVSPGRAFFPNEQAEKIEELAELKQQLKTAKLQRFEIMSNTAHRVRTVMAGAPGAAAALSEPAGSVRAAPAVAAAPSSPAGSAPAALPAAPGS